MTVTAAGFAPYEVKDIDLQVGQNLDLNVEAAGRPATTPVEVTAAAPLVDDTKTDVSQVVGTREIHGTADQRPPRRFFRAEYAGRDQ